MGSTTEVLPVNKAKGISRYNHRAIYDLDKTIDK